MAAHILDLDINAKIPIIRVSSDDNSIEHNNHNDNNNNNDHKLDLPKANFKLAKSRSSKFRKTTANGKRSDKYYHHEEPTPEMLAKRVEYDMDLEDEHWLKNFNQTIGHTHGFEMSENEFERTMDRLEKESFFEYHAPVVDEDAVCAICNEGSCDDYNAILFCDMCDLAVHQECYGVPYIPEGQWLCRRCLKSPLKNVQCVLCPNTGGAFKQTDKNKWAHVICALWIPEVCFANTVFLEPIDGIEHISSARWKLKCYICKQNRGACIQCQKHTCYLSFHVTCAQQANLYMKITPHTYENEDGGTFSDVKKEVFCDKHTPSVRRQNSGMYSGEESEEDVESAAYKKKLEKGRRKIRSARKALALQKEQCRSPAVLFRIDESKLPLIAQEMTLRNRKKQPKSQVYKAKLEFINHIHNYWKLKRESKCGVPLLRRLQINFYNHSRASPDIKQVEVDKYKNLRYDLEKCRLLCELVRKREEKKKELTNVVRRIHSCQLDIFDRDNPPSPC